MNDDLAFFLRNIARQLALIPTADVEKYVADRAADLERADGIGPLFDPTGYMRAAADGSMDDARNQLAIVKHLLAARKAIDVREAFAATKRPLNPEAAPTV